MEFLKVWLPMWVAFVAIYIMLDRIFFAYLFPEMLK